MFHILKEAGIDTTDIVVTHRVKDGKDDWYEWATVVAYGTGLTQTYHLFRAGGPSGYWQQEDPTNHSDY